NFHIFYKSIKKINTKILFSNYLWLCNNYFNFVKILKNRFNRMNKLKLGSIVLIKHSKFFRKIFEIFFSRITFVKEKLLEINFLEQYIHSLYSEESLKEKRFYN